MSDMHFRNPTEPVSNQLLLQAVVSEHEGGPAWTVFYIIPCQVNKPDTQSEDTAPAVVPTSAPAKTPSLQTPQPSAAAALSAAITSQLSHPATTRIPSILDLPAASTTSSSIVLPGQEGYDATLAESAGLHQGSAAGGAEAPGSRRRRKQASSAVPSDVPLRVGGSIKLPAGGAPAGSRLAAMVGDEDYYQATDPKRADDGVADRQQR